MNAINPLLALIAPALTQVLNDVKAAATKVAATPTLENANEQLVQLELEILNPTHLAGISIAGASQEVINLVDGLLAHLAAASAAPTAAAAPAES